MTIPKTINKYPSWICSDCGKEVGGWPKGHVGTFHNGHCDVCEQEKVVTEPRDYHYPSIQKLNIIRARLNLFLFSEKAWEE